MEYCSHCRAIRPTRKSSRKRTVRQPDGTMKTVMVESFHCARCNQFIGSVDREVAPERAPAPGQAPAATAAPGEPPAAPGETEPVTGEEVVEAATE